MLLFFFLIIPIILWLIPLSGIRKRENSITNSFILNFISMILTVTLAGVTMWLYGISSTTILVVLLSVGTSWGAIFHLIKKI